MFEKCKSKKCGRFSKKELTNLFNKWIVETNKKCSIKSKSTKCSDKIKEEIGLKKRVDDFRECIETNCKEEKLNSDIDMNLYLQSLNKSGIEMRNIVLDYRKEGKTDKTTKDKLFKKHRNLFKNRRESFDILLEEEDKTVKKNISIFTQLLRKEEKSLKKLEKELKQIKQKKGQKHTSKSKRNKKGGYRTKKRYVK